jgi:hypothetical protein
VLATYRAFTTFVEQTCARRDTEYMNLSDLVAWLEAQRPSVLRHLPVLPPVTRP